VKDRNRVALTKLKGWILRILVPFIALFAIQSVVQASEPMTIYLVEYIDDRLTVNVDNRALGSLLAAIQEKTGIEFVLSQEQSERLISIRFGSLPLVEGLTRVLSQFNHALLLGPSNKPVKVFVLSDDMSNSSARLSEGTEFSGFPWMISPPSVKTEDIKPAANEGGGLTSSSGGMDIHQSAGEGMVPTSSLEGMVTKPFALGEMVVTPSAETMVVGPASEKMIVTPPSAEIASMVENMMKGIKEGSNLNLR